MPKSITVPKSWFPPPPYYVFGRAVDGKTYYSLCRPNPKASVELIFSDDIQIPDDLDKAFKEALGEKVVE